MTSTTPPPTASPAPFRPVRHEVPYFAQWETPELVAEIVTDRLDAADDPNWRASGADSPEEYRFWSWRVCGMACLRMALTHWGIDAPPNVTLGKEYLEAGAYVPKDGGLHGLIYEPFARHTRARFGLHAESRPHLPLSEVAQQLRAGRLVMLSVHPGVRSADAEPPQRGGHLVLAVGADEESVTIHNPSGWHGTSQEFAAVPWPVMRRYYAERGVLLGPGDRSSPAST
ncbi:C39 family peptidase [Streptomyces sp. NPDC002073]|uniref:C39 family peptidase n=1 Tax=Streptomyces sp. NBC_00239 TaxID=2903640 RepID=UPI002E2A5600|nr:C39 family peptidase [Streptomyces sp. NBC_00239]